MSQVLTPEKAIMPLWDLIAKECGSEAVELINQEINNTWKRMAKNYGEDVAQEALCQAFEKASRGEVDKPLHYAAASAKHIAWDEWRRRVYALLYQRILSNTWSKSGAESSETDDSPLITFKKTRTPRLKKSPRMSFRDDRNPASQVEAKELLREIELNSSGLRLIRQAGGEHVKISASQVSKARARLLKRVLVE
jgi:DNA-directed RNA polymerase specialized sigma24 family protein